MSRSTVQKRNLYESLTMDTYASIDTDFKSDLSGAHPLVTGDRDTGNGYYLIARQYPTDDVEVVALRLNSDDRLRCGGGAKRKNKEKSEMTQVVLTKSQSRAKTQIRRKLMTMCADRMLTLTFKENLTAIDEAWRVFKYFNKLMKFRYRERWRYIAVPEYQKRGAVHFHLAVSGFYAVGTVRRLWRRASGKYGGNIDITDPRKYGKNSWNPKRISNYMAKYITKNDSVVFNKRRYSSGGEIVIPPALTGWLALGVPVVKVMSELIKLATRKPLMTVFEIDGYYETHVLTT